MINKSIKVNIKIQHEDFDVSKETQKLHDCESGAIINFIGLVREHNQHNNEQIIIAARPPHVNPEPPTPVSSVYDDATDIHPQSPLFL